jgi:NlpC/P60 family
MWAGHREKDPAWRGRSGPALAEEPALQWSAASEGFGVQVEGPPFGGAGGGEGVQQPAQKVKQHLLVVVVEGCEQGGGAVGVGGVDGVMGGAALVGERHQGGSSVLGVGGSPGEAVSFQPVDQDGDGAGANLQAGDLLFWAYNTSDPATIHHVAIYLGRDSAGVEWMIDAPHTGATIQVRRVYWTGYIGASRPLNS